MTDAQRTRPRWMRPAEVIASGLYPGCMTNLWKLARRNEGLFRKAGPRMVFVDLDLLERILDEMPPAKLAPMEPEQEHESE